MKSENFSYPGSIHTYPQAPNIMYYSKDPQPLGHGPLQVRNQATNMLFPSPPSTQQANGQVRAAKQAHLSKPSSCNPPPLTSTAGCVWASKVHLSSKLHLLCVPHNPRSRNQSLVPNRPGTTVLQDQEITIKKKKKKNRKWCVSPSPLTTVTINYHYLYLL